MANPATHASILGNTFVLQYYTLLNTNPSKLFHFYKERSMLTHGYEDGEAAEVFMGQENISKKFQSLGLNQCTVTLSVVDCQHSENGGILIMVLGSMCPKGDVPKKFVQTFYLAVQTEPAGYYVLNDIFRYIKEPHTHNPIPTTLQAIPSPAISNITPIPPASIPVIHSEQPKVTTPAPISIPIPMPTTALAPMPVPVPIPMPTVVPPVAASAPVVPPIPEKIPEAIAPAASANSTPKEEKPTPSSAPITPVEKKEQSEKKVTSHQEHRPVQKSSSSSTSAPTPATPASPKTTHSPTSPSKPTSPPTQGKPNSWAQLVTQISTEGEVKFHPPPSQPKAPVAAKTSSPSSAPATPPQVQQSDQKENDKNDKKDKKIKDSKGPKTPKNKFEKKDRQGASVYVSNVPFTIQEEAITNTFKALNIGIIKTTILRAHKGYAFIEYTTLEAAQQVIQHCKTNPITLEGRPLVIEERKPKSEFDKDKRSKKPYGRGKGTVDENSNGVKNGDASADGEKWQKYGKRSSSTL